jgi:hypothetical protein
MAAKAVEKAKKAVSKHVEKIASIHESDDLSLHLDDKKFIKALAKLSKVSTELEEALGALEEAVRDEEAEGAIA